MNKQQAIENIKAALPNAHAFKEEFDSLQELVDKETPMQVDKIDWTPTVIYRCVKCGKKITNGNYCINCGQALDWGNDDE